MIDPRRPNYASTPAAADRPAFGYAPANPHAPPLVSILTPFFNPGPVFHETACSVFRQSLQQFEWLIINDATPHAAARALLDEYRGRDPRIRVLEHEVNKGLSAARNTGVAAARSPYAFLLDDDDLLEPTALEKMYWFLETHPEFAAVNGWEVGFGASEYLWPLGFDRGADILKENCTTGRAMVRCAAHRAIGGHDESIRQGMEDWEYWLRLADHGMWGHTIPEYLDWYRRREQHQQRWENLDGGPRQRTFCDWLRRRYRRLYHGGFPNVRPTPHQAFDEPRPVQSEANLLAKPKPRLLMVIPRMSLGGAERAALELLKQLTARGWQVSIAALSNGDHVWMPEFARFTPDVFVLPNFLRPPDYPAFLHYLITSRRAEVVLTSGSELGYLLLPYLCSMCPEPVYLDLVHSEAPHWKNGGYARCSAGYKDYVDLTLVTSEHLKRYIAGRGGDPDRIEVLYLNIDPELWRPCAETRLRVRAELGMAPDETLIVFAGRLDVEKQPRVLAQTLHKLASRKLRFRAVLAGDGAEREWLEQFIKQHGLSERIRLLGEVPAERLREVLSAADIFFLPSLWEGIALTIFEAMACGVAVVGADVGGQRELVTPECGLLLPKRGEAEEVAAYATALEELIKDRERREQMGRNARQRIESHFTLAAMGERFFELLERGRQLHQRPSRPVLPGAAAREAAALAIEFVRVNDALDATWREAQNSWQRYERLKEGQARKNALTGAADGQLGAELDRLSAELAGIYNSTGWQVLQALYRIRFAMFPRGSRREHFAKRCMHAQRQLRQWARNFRRARACGSSAAHPGHGSVATATPRAGGSPSPAKVAGTSPSVAATGVDSGVPGLVSIVLPVHNQAGMLRASIESVLAQTYPDFELIVVHDGSTDGVEQVLAEYAGHPKIRRLTQANQELPKALSNGFEFARGQFWTWTSAGGLMEPRQIERQVEFLRSHPDVDMVYCDYLAIDDRGQPLRDPSFRPQNRRQPDSREIHLPRDPANLNEHDDNFIGACFMYRGWVGRLMCEYAPNLGVEDFDYWLRLNKLFRIAHLGSDELLYRYRVHDDALNALAAERRIPEPVQRLMVLDRRRQAFYSRPWVVHADEPTRAWLGNIVKPPHAVTGLAPGPSSAASDEKMMYLVRADRLPELARQPRPQQACIVAWFDGDPRAPYQYSDAVRNVADLCFVPDAKTAARLELHGGRVVQALPGAALWSAAASFANNDVFYKTTTPAADRHRALPRPLAPQRRLRVLLQADHFLQGGFEQVVMDIAQVLDPERFDLAILALGREGPAAAEARALGLTYLRLPAGEPAAAYRQFLLDNKFDLINAHYAPQHAAIADELGIPFVQTVHSTYVSLDRQQLALHRAADRHTRAYICVSAAAAAYADVRLGCGVERMIIVPNGVNTEALDAAKSGLDRAAQRRALGLTDDDFVFLHVGSIYPPKGHHLLLNALAAVRRRNPRVKVAFLGRVMDEAYAARVRGQAARLGIADVILWLGYQISPQRFYFLCDGFVLPSFVEGWSLALAEALYARLPVIATDVGGARDVVSRFGGTLLAPPYASILDLDAATLYKLLDQPHPQFVDALAEAMLTAAESDPPPALPAELAQHLDRRHAYQSYARVFDWVAAGGDVAAARPWVWEARRDGASATPAAMQEELSTTRVVEEPVAS